VTEYGVGIRFRINKEKISEDLLKELFDKFIKFDLKQLSEENYKKRLEHFLHKYGTGIDMSNPFDDQLFEIALCVSTSKGRGLSCGTDKNFIVCVSTTDRIYFPVNDEKRNYIQKKVLELAKVVYDTIHPEIGLFSYSLPEGLSTDEYENWLSSINFYGPKLVKKIGKEKILSTPAYKIEELKEGGVLILLNRGTKNTLELIEEEIRVAEHLGLKSANINSLNEKVRKDLYKKLLEETKK